MASNRPNREGASSAAFQKERFAPLSKDHQLNIIRMWFVEILMRHDFMSLIIDGYNVMFVSRFDPDRTDPHALRRNREAFLEFLSKRIDRSRHKSVAIVFDAEKKIAKLPDRYTFRQIDVYFAQDHVSADDLIEELIKQDSVPKKLIVVSSDHRLQRAAKRRGAKWQDSDEWFDRLTLQDQNTEIFVKPKSGIRYDSKTRDERVDGRIDAEQLVEGSNGNEVLEKDGQALESDSPFPDGYADDLG